MNKRTHLTARQKSGVLLGTGAAFVILGYLPVLWPAVGRIWCAICGGGVLMALGVLVGLGRLR